MVLGERNGRVGKRKNEAEEVIGRCREEVRNNNGERNIDSCMHVL